MLSQLIESYSANWKSTYFSEDSLWPIRNRTIVIYTFNRDLAWHMSKFPSSCSTKLSSLGYLTVFVAFSPQILEVWSLLLWKFGLGSYVRSKFHWPLAPRSPVPWIKTSCCVESSKQRNVFCVVLMTLRSTMFWFTEPQIAALKANET